MVLTLYGYAQNAREEYLLLKLIKVWPLKLRTSVTGRAPLTHYS